MRKISFIAVVVAIYCVTITVSTWAASVDGVRIWRAPDHTRVVFDLTSAVEHKIFSLEKPDRLVIDIKNTTIKASLDDLPLDKTPISDIRVGKRNRHDMRVVLDLSRGVKPRSFVLKKHGNKNDRLVIDLYDADQKIKKTVANLSDQLPNKRDIIVAIDPGHGGEDPGALGPGKVREKDVVMAISRELKKLIDREPGYQARLIRTGDYYVPLYKRRDIARKMRADLFISIHADAFKNPKAYGASVFALSRRGATSESARFLANKENEADLIGGVGGVSLDDKDDVLSGVLVDLSMTASLSNSLLVGDKVLRQVGKVNRLHKKQVEQAGFAVLKSPDVPSILVETGFISNPGEARKLNTRKHRQKLARAIFTGVKQYFNESPPEGSFVAWKKSGKTLEYVIARGDTLSGIAKRYRVSVAQLKKINGLSSATIRIGQRLVIPTS